MRDSASSHRTMTRAQAPAREAARIVVRRVMVPPGSRRVPLVLVEVDIGPIRATFSVARLRGGALDVRPPRRPDGTGEGLWMRARQRARLGNLILRAVREDDLARRTLAGD